jgi:hypothetical protein
MVAGKRCNPTFLLMMLAFVLLLIGYFIANEGVNREIPTVPLHHARVFAAPGAGSQS